MTQDQDSSLQSNWPLAAQHIKETWKRLSDLDIDAIDHAIDGRAERLTSLLRERYGYSRERAEQECGAVCKQLEGGSQDGWGWQGMGAEDRSATTMSGRSYRGARSLGADERIEQERAFGRPQRRGGLPGETQPLRGDGEV
jgi:uncharacterized protein YjbJ (UPF0337 family)